MIYDGLEAFCEVHNDLIAHEPAGRTAVGAFEIGEIDFDALVTLFFWDTDFLAGDALTRLSVKQRQQLGVGEETFGLAAGLAPHSDELRLTSIVGRPNWIERAIEFEKREIACYPLIDDDAS